jgi:glycosyltransferase involved in cell wall biosynthesis
MKKKITIITIVRDRENSIGCAIRSLNSQDYENIEHVIIDGASKDNTLKIIESLRSPDSVLLSEIDEGIYDALNKGISMATGEIIGVLHSDDYYEHTGVLSSVMNCFEDQSVDAVYGDVNYVDSNGVIVRYYSSKNFSKSQIQYARIMAHTALFLKKKIYTELGGYKKHYRIAGDFELIARFFTQKNLHTNYINTVLVNMKMGGASNNSIISRFRATIEIRKACRENNIQTNYFKICCRYFHKLFEYSSIKRIINFII